MRVIQKTYLTTPIGVKLKWAEQYSMNKKLNTAFLMKRLPLFNVF